MNNKKFLFIIGAPRSGTTWLQAMLGAHPQVCTTVELTLFARYIGPWLRAWEEEQAYTERTGIEQGLPFIWDAAEVASFIREFLERAYGRVCEAKPEATHILDKFPGYAYCVRDINRLIPSAKFVHLVRDGRDVALSMVAAQKSMGFGTDTIASSAWSWQDHIQAARMAAGYEGRYLEVRYEDLRNTGVDTVHEVFEFCGLDVTRAQIEGIVRDHQFERMKARSQSSVERTAVLSAHYRKGQVAAWLEEMKPIDRYRFQKIAGRLLCELGYAQAGWWSGNRLDASLLPMLYAIERLPSSLRARMKGARN